MDKVDWSKSPAGATHHGCGHFYKKIEGKWFYFSYSCGSWVESSNVEKWFKENLIPHPAPTWQGPQDGLPPVGTECMYHNGSKYGSKYVHGKIVAHVDDGDGIDAIIQCDGAWYCGRSPDSFRPLKSDRDKAIDEIGKVIDKNLNNYPLKVIAIAEAIYDAGFRKESAE